MGERAKKKRAADASAARKAKKAAEQLQESVEDPATSSDKKLPTRSNTKPPKKTCTAPRVASGASTRRSTHLHIPSSTLRSGKLASAKDSIKEGKLTRLKRSATIAAKALLEQLQITED